MAAPTIDLLKIKEKAEEYGNNVDKMISEGKKVLFLFGGTGSGKTTTTALLEGKSLNIIKKNRKTYVLGLEGSGIGHSHNSETKIPNIHNLSSYIIIDNPGFEDSGGVETEILNSYNIYKLMEKCKSSNQTKIIIVASHYELDSQGPLRGNLIKTILNRLKEMFPKNLSLINLCGLVVTKSISRNLSENDYVPEIIEQFDKNNIFCFPEPENDRDKIYQTDQTDLSNLINFCNNNSRNIILQDFQPSLNAEAKNKLKDMIDIQKESNSKAIDTIIKETENIIQQYCNTKDKNCQKDFDEIITFLKENIKNLEHFQKSDYKPIEFVSDFKKEIDKIKKNQQVTIQNMEKNFEILEKSSSLSDFIEQILNTKQITEDFQKSKNLYFNNIIIKLKEKIKEYELLDEERKRKEEERKRKEEERKRKEEERKREEEERKRKEEERKRKELELKMKEPQIRKGLFSFGEWERTGFLAWNVREITTYCKITFQVDGEGNVINLPEVTVDSRHFGKSFERSWDDTRYHVHDVQHEDGAYYPKQVHITRSLLYLDSTGQSWEYIKK